MEKRSEVQEGTCPKCTGKMIKHFSSISGNSKYITWQCEECEYAQTKCTGVLP